MIKKFLYILIFLTSQFMLSQEHRVAQEYFRKGEFEKAASSYEKLYKTNKHNTYYFKHLLASYQALEDYKKVENLINERITAYPKQEFLWVELGYNHDLQHQNELAKPFYDKAFQAVDKNPKKGYQIARSFHDNHLLDYALKSYKLMMEVVPAANFNYQIAAIYGEKGDIEMMFDTYLAMVAGKGGKIENIQRFIGRYVSDDALDKNNILFRKLLVKRSQQNPKDEWNKLLSWLYLQQKDYSKALLQEKAVFIRSKTDLDGIIDVGTIAFESKDFDTTNEAFSYILEQANDVELQLLAQYYILESKRELISDTNLVNHAYQKVLSDYGKGSNTTNIQVSYADFLTFSSNQPQKAINVLNEALENRLDRFQKAKIKIQLADVLVYTGKYNQALIKYSQVQTNLKNHELAQEARFKVAQTSYFKGDFDWANIQLKVLKKGTSKLISNDAIDLSLLIEDNKGEDSLRVALKSYAKADLLAFQNKNQQAIDTLAQLIINHKGHAVEDEALFKQAELYQKAERYEAASQNYLTIISLKNNDILIDDAIYQLAVLYDTYLNHPEIAKKYYKKIVFEYPSSIYLVPSRKRFRKLRGDVVLP